MWKIPQFVPKALVEGSRISEASVQSVFYQEAVHKAPLHPLVSPAFDYT